jgi:D-amino-acid dehydrogenase
MLPRVGKGKANNVFYNTGHGHLGWTLSAITADMVASLIATQSKSLVVSSQVGINAGRFAHIK